MRALRLARIFSHACYITLNSVQNFYMEEVPLGVLYGVPPGLWTPLRLNINTMLLQFAGPRRTAVQPAIFVFMQPTEREYDENQGQSIRPFFFIFYLLAIKSNNWVSLGNNSRGETITL